MAKGGFTGAVPPRETSPEDYSGVWDITEQFSEQKAGSWPFQPDDCARKSVRFDGASSNLERTFNAAGNRTAWSWSCWLKRGRLNSGRQVVFGSYDDANDDTWLEFGVDNANAYYTTNNIAGSSNAALRDPAAFYHYFANFDGTTFKIFINNVEVLSSTSLAGTRGIAGRYRHRIGQSPASHAGNIRYFDGLMAECHFLDGQILSPSDFAFYDGQGTWQPKRFTGEYSNGPVYSANSTGGAFYSNFTWADAFDGKLTTGPFVYSSTTNTLTLPPGVTWSNSIRVYALRYDGAFEINGTNILSSHTITTTAAWHDLTTTLGSSGTLSTITIGGVNTNYFKLFAVELDGRILTNPSVGVNSFHLDFSQDELGEVKDQSGLGNHWTAESIGGPIKGLIAGVTINAPSQVTLQTAEVKNMFNGSKDNFTYAHTNDATNYIQWTPTGGYSTNGHIWIQGGDGNGAGANTMEVQINGSVVSRTAVVDNETYSQAGYGWGDWHKYPVAGNTLTSLRLTGAYALIRQLSTVDDPTHSVLGISDDNDVPAITDTLPSLTDYFVDSPVNGNESSTPAGGERRGNYATLTPLTGAQTLTNGNLDVTGGSSWQRSVSTIAMSSGKWYWEYKITASNEHLVGVGPLDMQMSGNLGAGSPPGSGYGTEVGHVNGTGANSSWTNTGGSTTGDLIGVAFDADAGEMYIYKNGTALNNGIPSHAGLTDGPYVAVFSLNGSSRSGSVNFGQRPFEYQNAGTDRPSSDYKPLATCFLPEPSELAKNPSKAFDILLWSGDGANSDRTITGIDMESGPDMVWSKTRNHGYHHNIFDAVRGFGASGGPPLTTDYISGQANAGVIKSTDSTSITWEKDSSNGYVWYGESGKNYVSWLWDAGTATTSVSVGASNSQAFDQSQRWRDYLTSSIGFHTSYPKSKAFNGAFDGGGGSATNGTNGTVTFTPPAMTVTSLEVSVYNTVTITLPDGTSQTVLGVANADKYRTVNVGSGFSFTGSNSITFTNNDYVYLERIRINGKELVDDDVSINTPEAACEVRANPEAGFSIVKVNNPNSTEARVHGLSKAPDFIIAKAIASGNTQHYHIFHSHFGRSNYATFTGDAWAGSDQWGSQEPTNTSFFVKANTGSGANYAGGMIYYIWHAVENYSAMGSYVGNGGNDGPMIHLGFEPKWVMVKGASGSTFWRIWDAEREPNNSKSLTFSPNSALDENQWSADGIDFLSNGFKIRSTGSYHNNQFQTYVYVAFAANPFAHARAH